MEQMGGGTLTLPPLGAQVCRLFDYYMCTHNVSRTAIPSVRIECCEFTRLH